MKIHRNLTLCVCFVVVLTCLCFSMFPSDPVSASVQYTPTPTLYYKPTMTPDTRPTQEVTATVNPYPPSDDIVTSVPTLAPTTDLAAVPYPEPVAADNQDYLSAIIAFMGRVLSYIIQ